MAVTGYEILIDGTTLIDVGNVLTYDVGGLGPDTLHSFQVRAYDGAGNRSAYCDAVSATTDPAAVFTNFALASNGSTATATSSATADLGPERAINGYRHTNNNWNAAGPGSGWNSLTDPATTPQVLEVDFGTSRTISEIDVFTLADALNYATDPTLTDTGASYQIIDFTVDYWDGAAWQNIATITGNNFIWKQFTFAAVACTKIRVRVTNGSGAAARIVELEAWGY